MQDWYGRSAKVDKRCPPARLDQYIRCSVRPCPGPQIREPARCLDLEDVRFTPVVGRICHGVNKSMYPIFRKRSTSEILINPSGIETELVESSKPNRIAVTAYSPLGFTGVSISPSGVLDNYLNTRVRKTLTCAGTRACPLT